MKEISFPAMQVKMIPVAKIVANDYNPNKVAPTEMKLLIKSIEEDGVTQPIVVFHNKSEDVFEIVDGFHRFTVLSKHFKLDEVPCVEIGKDRDSRMSSTIRHNRARGSHDINLMMNIVGELVDAGKTDTWIMRNLGMDADELLRFKQISGLASMFLNQEFSESDEGVE